MAVVLFPDPFGPMRVTILPFSTWRDTPLTSHLSFTRNPASFNFRETAAYQSAIKGLSAQVEVEAKKESKSNDSPKAKQILTKTGSAVGKSADLMKSSIGRGAGAVRSGLGRGTSAVKSGFGRGTSAVKSGFGRGTSAIRGLFTKNKEKSSKVTTDDSEKKNYKAMKVAELKVNQ